MLSLSFALRDCLNGLNHLDEVRMSIFNELHENDRWWQADERRKPVHIYMP